MAIKVFEGLSDFDHVLMRWLREIPDIYFGQKKKHGLSIDKRVLFCV